MSDQDKQRTPLPFPSRQELEQIIQYNEQQGEVMEMAIKQFARLMRMRYTSLLESGFNDEQAMQIIVTRGLM